MSEDKLKEVAIRVIYNYYDGLYKEEYIAENFNLAVDLMVENSKNRISGASSFSENGISVAYSGDLAKFSLNADILALLPKKKKYRAW